MSKGCDQSLTYHHFFLFSVVVSNQAAREGVSQLPQVAGSPPAASILELYVDASVQPSRGAQHSLSRNTHTQTQPM